MVRNSIILVDFIELRLAEACRSMRLFIGASAIRFGASAVRKPGISG
jgi:hypothetical protein